MRLHSIGSCAGALALAFSLQVEEAKAAPDTLLYSFCSQKNCTDGANPFAGLTNVDGELYGTTYDGGTGCSSCGVVYSIDPETGAETLVFSFPRNGAQGANPNGAIVSINGILYGTTRFGGAINGGTVFSLDPATGVETVLHSFLNGNPHDGYDPFTGLISVNDTLYGMTPAGGSNSCSCGTVFSVDTATGAETITYSFQGGKDGGNPDYGNLVDLNGILYGTTGSRGKFGSGVVFAIDLSSGKETVVHAFNGIDGAYPTGLMYLNGVLYGTTAGGGAYSSGVLFSLDPATGRERVLHSFGYGKDGSGAGNLIAAGRKWYGTTGGNKHGTGTIFSFDPTTRIEKVVHSFGPRKSFTDGAYPEGVVDLNNTLYVTTERGGASHGGAIVTISVH